MFDFANVIKAIETGNHLGYEGCRCRTANTKTKDENKEKVQSDVYKSSRNHSI